MERVESVGKNIQEAIDNGLQELGLTLDDVNVEVLSEGGLFKSAKVRLSKKESFAELFMKTNGENNKNQTIEQNDNANKECVSENIEQTATMYSLGVLNKILKMYKPTVYATERVQNKVVVFEIQGEGCEVFGNSDAVTSLQTILNTIERGHNKSENLKRIIVNVGDYEKRREADLRAQAIKCADEAISSGKTIRMQPMNSFERHLVHDFLIDRKDVVAESFGVEPYRYITVRPADTKQL